MNKKEIFDLYLETVSNAIPLLKFCRDVDLQKKYVDNLKAEITVFKNFKIQARKYNDENLANCFFGCHNYLNSLKSCLQSVIELKEKRPLQGWDCLVDAEEYYKWASKAPDCLINEFDLLDFMKKMEEILYPNFRVYSSLGFKTTKGQCSVCLKPIDECDHIEGLVYSGYACIEINKQMLSIDHSAIVEHPEDRRCIPTALSDKGKMIDYFTKVVISDLSEEEKKGIKDGQMQARWVMMNNHNLDIN